MIADRISKITESQTLAITARAMKMKKDGINVISLSAGEPDFDTPKIIQEAAIQAIRDGFTHYTPNPGIPELREAIVNKFKNDNLISYNPDQVLVSNGGKHSIANFFLAVLNKGDEVIIPAPYWVTYPEIVKLAEGVPVIISAGWENEYKITPDQLEQAITKNTKVFVLNSPSNPTGTVYTKEEIINLCQVAVDHHLIILTDEIYEYLIFNGIEHYCPAANESFYNSTCVVNGVSKAYAMTGWRIGYLAGPPDIIKAAGKIQSQMTSNAASISQKAALAALTMDKADIQAMKNEFVKRRQYMIDRVKTIPFINLSPPGGAFYIFPNFKDVLGRSLSGKKILSVTDFCEILLSDYHIAGVPGEAFGDENAIRFSYATDMASLKIAMDQLELAVNNLE